MRVRAAGRSPSRREVIESAERMWQRRKGMDQYLRRHFEESPIYDYGPPRLKVTNMATRTRLGIVDVEALADQPEVYEFRGQFKRALVVDAANFYRIPSNLANHWFRYDDDFAWPELLIDWIEIEGPIADEKAIAARSNLVSAFGSTQIRGSDRQRAEAILSEFMRRAWRRPVTKEEVASKLALFEKVRPQESRFEDALAIPLIVILTSPNFLYLVEPSDNSPARPLSAHELASRLSYFLWSSMPDDELFELASSGKLTEESKLHAQIDRMLVDRKSERFVKNFAGQWLSLRKVGTNPPARQQFPRYDDHLEKSMVRESESFFAEILHNDLNVMNFVKSDFVTVNERLARFYGIRGVKGDAVRRVPVPNGVPRGGLMTQASVLTVTSNGTRTVPVWHGVWVMENILGERVPPPPPNAGEIPQLTSGNRPTTIRARMEQHRQVAACATCHEKIDPLGFALENFRGDGGWATQEANESNSPIENGSTN